MIKKIKTKYKNHYIKYLEAEPEEHHKLLKKILKGFCWFLTVWLMTICIISITGSVIYNIESQSNILKVIPKIIAPNAFFVVSLLFIKKYLITSQKGKN